MRKFLKKLSEFIKTYALISPRDKIVVGFSGGADSMALLYSLWELSSELQFFIIAAHVNYNLRGEDSQKDEQFVREVCATLNIPLLVKQANIEGDRSIELKAREIRKDFFNKIVKLYKANSIALGHNANDQAETILLNLFRGAGTNGLKGILPKNDIIIHPLIEFSRKEIEEYLSLNNLNYRIDKSNYENIYSRNKIRNILMPFVLENINPKFVEKTINTARVLRESETVISVYANRLFKSVVLERNDSKIVLSLTKLEKYLPVIRFYFYKKIHTEFTGSDRDFFQYHFEEIEKLLKSDGCKQKSFPSNITVFKEYNKLTFQKTSTIVPINTDNKRTIDKIRARIKFENYRLYFKKLKKIDETDRRNKGVIFMDLDKIKFPITFRHRKNGDKFIPRGHIHPKKLKEFFIDKKISKFERDKILVMEDSEKILWIAGYEIDNRVAVTKDTSNFLMIRLEYIKHPKKRMAERFKRLLY